MGTYFRNTLLTHTRLEHWRAYNSPNPDSLSPIPSTDTTPTSNTNNSNTNNNNTNNVNITTLVTNTNPAPAAYADSTSEFVPTSQDSYRQTTYPFSACKRVYRVCRCARSLALLRVSAPAQEWCINYHLTLSYSNTCIHRPKPQWTPTIHTWWRNSGTTR